MPTLASPYCESHLHSATPPGPVLVAFIPRQLLSRSRSHGAARRQLQHENIIQLKDILKPTAVQEFRDVYLVYEIMDTDLHSIIRSNQPLSDDHVQYFIYQVLRGLKYIHSANVLHRDLKPSNLLLKANCDLKICDFGLARTQRETEQTGFMTDYVVTRWYRAPELLVSCETYSAGIDGAQPPFPPVGGLPYALPCRAAARAAVWSVGCILAELLGRKALWPGKTYIDQLQKILAVLGTPSQADTEFIDSDKARAWIHSQAITKRTPWASLYPAASPNALDLLQKMLQARAAEHPRRRARAGGAAAAEPPGALVRRAVPPQQAHFGRRRSGASIHECLPRARDGGHCADADRLRV